MTDSLYQWLRSNSLQNQYFIIRHGESTANVAGLIVSSPENGVGHYGLSEKGSAEVRDSFLREQRLASDTQVYCSDFKRTIETAEIACECLSAEVEYQPESLLRERNFGEFELMASDNYPKVWEYDAINPSHTHWSVESVTAVIARLQEFLIRVEAKHRAKNILIVSHGDILQILQTAFDGIDPSRHRSISHLNTAEIRQLIVLNN